jgi:cephalosporin-C deacetylase-like acetyl esterase
MPTRASLIFGVIWLLAATVPSQARQFVVIQHRPDCLYRTGDAARWKVQWQGPGPPPAASYSIRWGGPKEMSTGRLNLVDNSAQLGATLNEPGTMLVEVKWQADVRENRAVGAAVADPDRITPAAPPPEDFDAFWKAKLEDLSRVPPNAKLQRADAGKRGVDYWKVTLDNIRGTRIRGQLARPREGETFPALLIVQWAGVYPLQQVWATDRAAEGWLALNILPHDLPIDEPESFYKQQFEGPLKNYWAIGNDDPDTSYYLCMYLSCYRAIEYLKSRADWDGKTLVVMGTSQGGQQALVTAGLQADSVTAVLPFLPAACDMLAPEQGRASGFPHWYNQTHGKDPQKVRSASRYYDPIHFARRIKCPVLIGLALRDELAPPASVLAAANVIAAPKEVIILPNAGHQDENGSQAPYNQRCYGAWLPALRQGKPPPIKPGITSTP